MYCPICGKEIKTGEKHCTCGAKVGDIRTTSTPDTGLAAELGLITNRLANAGENKIALVLSCILPILCVALLSNPMFDISYELFGYANTLDFQLFENEDSPKAILYIGYAVALVMIIWPAFTDGKWSRKNFIPGMIMPVVAGILFWIAIIRAKNEIASGELAPIMKAINLEVQISKTGWLYLTSSLVSLFATVDAYLGTVLKRVRNAHSSSK